MSTTGHESEAINVQGLKASLQKLKTDHIDGKSDKSTTLAGYGITDAYTKNETYTKTEVNGLVDTPHQEYVTVDAYANLPAEGSADTIYRVSNWDGSANSGAGAVDATVYSEYAWDDVSDPNKYVFLCVKSQIGEVFDISVYNNNAKYADLAAALNGGANIPQSLQKGGMSVKFVQSSDNKYVQYRYMPDDATTVATFTNVANWQGIDIKPIPTSRNVIESGGVANAIYNYESKTLLSKSQLFFTDVAPTIISSSSTALCEYFPCSTGDMFRILASYSSGGSNRKLYIGTTTEVPAAGVTVSNIVSFDGKDVDTVYTASGNGFIVIAVYVINWPDVQLKLVTEKLDALKDEINEEFVVQSGTTDIHMTTGAYIDANGEIHEIASRYHLSNKINVSVGDKFQYALVSFNSSIITLYDANDRVLEININNRNYVTGVYTVSNPLASYMYFGYQDGNGSNPIFVNKLSYESIKDFVISARPMYGKVIYLFGDSISSTQYPWYKEYLEKYTGAEVFPMGASGRTTGYLAKNTYFDKLATIGFDVCVALTGANDVGAEGSVGTFSADTELYAMGEPIVEEPSIDVTDYDDTDKKLIQSISYIIRKWKKLYWNFRLKANLNACILDGENNFEVVYPLSGTATEQECITYAAEHDMGDIGYFQGRYFLRTTETPESKREKLMSVKHPKLYYCTTFPRRINSPSDWHSDLVMAERKRLAIIECCQKYGIPCIDLAKEWMIQWSEEPCSYNPDNRPFPQWVVDNEGIYTMDGVHPNEFGYEWIARIVAKELNA